MSNTTGSPEPLYLIRFTLETSNPQTSVNNKIIRIIPGLRFRHHSATIYDVARDADMQCVGLANDFIRHHGIVEWMNPDNGLKCVVRSDNYWNTEAIGGNRQLAGPARALFEVVVYEWGW